LGNISDNNFLILDRARTIDNLTGKRGEEMGVVFSLIRDILMHFAHDTIYKYFYIAR